MAGSNTLEIIGRELGKTFEPLDHVISSPSAFEGFMHELGWKVQLIPNPIQNLASATGTLISKLTIIVSGNPGLDDYLDLIDAVKDLVDAIKDLENASFSPFPSLIADGFATKFPQQLVDFLVITYLDKYHHRIFSSLKLLGIIKVYPELASGNRPTYLKREIVWSNIVQVFSNPMGLIQSTYGWGTAHLNYDELFHNLQSFLLAFRYISFFQGIPAGLREALETVPGQSHFDRKQLTIPIFSRDVSGAVLEAGLSLYPLYSNGTTLPGISLLPYFHGTFGQEYELAQNLFLRILAALDLQGGVGIKLIPQQGIQTFWGLGNPSAGSYVNGELKVQLVNEDKSGAPIILLGSPDETRLEYKALSLLLGLGIDSTGVKELKFEIELVDFLLAVEPSQGDGFLQKILAPEGIEAQADLALGFSSINGFYFRGSASLEVALAKQIDLGPLTILNVIVRVVPASSDVKVESFFDLKLELGPFMAIVQGLGIRGKFSFPGSGGNLGPINAEVGFKPPMGIGLSIDASAFKGGGYLFFDYENESYAGVLELTIKETISVKAIGLLTTRFPDGSKGFSLLLMITAEFTPIQLGFGFTLNGVGGMIGINRTMVLSALRDGVKSGSINNIMFPADPVANATQIISDLKTIFPPQEGRFAFGPMGKIGWGTPTLITMDVGLFIELPAPVRLAIIGIIRMLLPDENKQLLKLQVAFVGTIDFEQKFITFDASIFDSRLLTFTLEGDMAVRIKWGENSNFVFTVGGFHPQYVPPPLQLPVLKRLTINLLGGDNPRLTIQTYFAVTSNTVQFGSRVDFYFKVTGKCKVLGWLGFDALFQFSPFYFNVSFSAGLAVYWKNDPFLSISLTVMLEGPTPWHAKGTAEFKILIFKFKVNFDKTWGQQATTTLPDKAVFAELKAAIEHRANWLATKSGTTDPLVTLRAIDTSNPNKLLITPDGGLSVSQKVVPMDVTISKFGNQKPSDYNLFHLDLLDGNNNLYVREDVKEEFAPNSFFNLNNSEKLSRPNFERYNAGLKGKAQSEAITSSLFQERDVEYEQILMDNRFTPPLPLGIGNISAASFGVWTKNGSASNSAFGTKVKGESLLRPPKVSVVDKGYSVVDLDAGGVYLSNHAVTFEEAHQKLQDVLRTNPELEGQLQVLPSHEIA